MPDLLQLAINILNSDKVRYHARITQRSISILIRLPLKATPSALATKPAPATQELLVRVARAPGIVAHNHADLGVRHEVRVLVIDDDETRAAVLEDVGHLLHRQARVDGAYHRACGDYAVVGICAERGSEFRCKGGDERRDLL